MRITVVKEKQTQVVKPLGGTRNGTEQRKKIVQYY